MRKQRTEGQSTLAANFLGSDVSGTSKRLAIVVGLRNERAVSDGTTRKHMYVMVNLWRFSRWKRNHCGESLFDNQREFPI